ncbi:Hint domain-containing protein [Streptomyces sp. NPDC001822]|uniref:Hint domain-containing protein n=1 Tax=Streptomyces sp. NPDC001822 TaxID=3364614 RepID=UPI0036926963
MSGPGVVRRRPRRWPWRSVPRTEVRLLGLRRSCRGQRGQGAVEYLGLVVVVVAIVGALVATGIGAELSEKISAQVCRIGGGGDCGGGGGGDPESQEPPGDGTPASDDGTPRTAAQIDYDAALKELQDARKAEKSSSDKALEAAKELARILAEELGITDALDCITKGDMGACTETLINVLLSLVGGAVGKLAAKYGAPWKWKKAAKLIQALKKHGGDLYDGLKNLVKNRKKVKDAEKKLADARKKLDAEKKDPPEKDGKPDDKPTSCPVSHSFPPGTPVLVADGRRVPIQSVRAGDGVLATDPVSGVSEVRRVTETFTTHDDKHFTRLTTSAGRITATDTHPFWVTGSGRWVDAGDIVTGERLRLSDGTSLQVTGVSRHTQRQTTYDLSVEGIHAYYVGVGTAAALVHNNDCEFDTDPSVKGPAAGKKLKPPHPRHTVSGVRNGMVKEKNTVILKGNEADIQNDVKGIAEGRAKLVDNGSAYEINGRKYGVEENGRTFPISGKGLVELDRNEYAALKEIARAGGKTDSPALTRNPRFADHPEVVEKAKKVYDGTYS